MENKRFKMVLVLLIMILVILIMAFYKLSQPSYFAIKSDTVKDQVHAYKLITESNEFNDLYLEIGQLIEKNTKISSEEVNKIIDTSGYKNVDKDRLELIDTKINYTINSSDLDLSFYYNESKKLIERIDAVNKGENLDIQVFRDDTGILYIQSFKKCKNSIQRYLILKNLRANDIEILDDTLRKLLK
ncbi:hypothetical protein QOZ84_02050 [Romboutsia sedimentorum]|uniref:Uncharacterized protein n=1 Tax=Romboutsia sedimentorum TaxID=1368474 RepID=A0ABT7E5Y5_9FIRM|nr:hypothetical protein [Romboutsia sedimentorum]MDK2562316.1 hypothetical protein [Romboutsia sedimentorum]